MFNAHQTAAAAKLLSPVWATIEKGTMSSSEDVVLGVCVLLMDLDFANKAYSRIAGK